MENIFSFFEGLAIDVNTQARLLLTFLHLPVVIVLLFLLRQERSVLLKNGHRTTLLFVLKEFYLFCHAQYQSAIQYLARLHEVQEPFSGLPVANMHTDQAPERLGAMLLRHPSVLLYQYHALKAGTHLLTLRDKVAFQQEDMQALLQLVGAAYKSREEVYYENMQQLANMYNALEENNNRKVFNKGQQPDWALDYQSIFNDWQNDGARRDLEHSYRQIVVKVLELNTRYKDVSFVLHAYGYALKCGMAYEQLTEMKARLQQKLNSFAWTHRLACRITALIITLIDARAMGKEIKQPARNRGRRRWRLFSNRSAQVTWPVTRIPHTRWMKFGLYVVVCLLTASGILLTLQPLPVKRPPVNPTPAAPAQPALQQKNTVGLAAPLTKVDMPGAGTTMMTNVYGIDISRYQGNLLADYNHLDTLHFVICKATEGIDYIDPDFATNWYFIRRKQLLRGAYHFFRLNDDPVQQGQHFLKTIKTLDSTDMPPAIDIEEGSLTGRADRQILEKNLLTLLEYVERNSKRKPMIYTDLDFANTYLRNPLFAAYPLWLAEYSGSRRPTIPDCWKEKGYVIWQREDSYHIRSTRTDFDVFNGTWTELQAFIRNH